MRLRLSLAAFALRFGHRLHRFHHPRLAVKHFGTMSNIDIDIDSEKVKVAVPAAATMQQQQPIAPEAGQSKDRGAPAPAPLNENTENGPKNEAREGGTILHSAILQAILQTV